ncbi:septation protein SepH [Nocardioides sp.]|uniref:septation protein SepH n=1 Tax=Nocardioides sp. TaxID=35761 RepID=UPI00273314FC|nr:septation protein SepH [Nocardioides sp.]MDP3890419.1 septation protein SepH [Nocardioides sp.]
MVHLTLAGLSDDGKRLLLVSDAGVEFTLTIDDRLRAALRGEHARIGQLEIQMDSALRPRDIQARIRAGETPEAVAQAAQTTVDRIMPFAGPVLAERAHVAERAQRSSVRRKAGDAGARTLGEAVAAQVQPLGVSPDTVSWDAWRREDGRWALTAAYSVNKRRGTAQFTFDAPGNYVTMDNDDAKWLVGESGGAGTAAAAERDDLQQVRRRRLTAVPADELPLGDDALELVSEPEATPEPEPEPAGAAEPEPEPEPAPEPEPSSDPAAEEPPARRPSKKRGRASVPSWDEIMFGGGKSE